MSGYEVMMLRKVHPASPESQWMPVPTTMRRFKTLEAAFHGTRGAYIAVPVPGTRKHWFFLPKTSDDGTELPYIWYAHDPKEKLPPPSPDQEKSALEIDRFEHIVKEAFGAGSTTV